MPIRRSLLRKKKIDGYVSLETSHFELRGLFCYLASARFNRIKEIGARAETHKPISAY